MAPWLVCIPVYGASVMMSGVLQVWVEFANVMAPDNFGESSLLGRGLRAGAALCGSTVEVLKLNKVDFDMKVDVNVGAVIQTVVANYPKDSKFIRCVPDFRLLDVRMHARRTPLQGP